MRSKQISVINESFKRLRKLPAYKRLSEIFSSNEKNADIVGLPAGSLSFTFSSLLDVHPKIILIITNDNDKAGELIDDFEFFNIPNIFHFPKSDILPYDEESLHLEVASKRLDTYSALISLRDEKVSKTKISAVFITSISAILEKVPPLSYLQKSFICLSWGDNLKIADLVDKLVTVGYEKTHQIESRGEFSVRGSIVDIFPINADNPIRLDYFGDEIEDIKYFDVSTQRSFKSDKTIENVSIPPVNLKQINYNAVSEGVSLIALTDLFPNNTCLIIDNEIGFEEASDNFISLCKDRYKKSDKDSLENPAPQKLFISYKELKNSFSRLQTINHSDLKIGDDKSYINFGGKDFDSAKPSLENYISILNKRQREDFLIHIICDNDGQVQRLDEIFHEKEMSSVPLYLTKDNSGYNIQFQSGFETSLDIIISVGDLHKGFLLNEAHIIYLTDREIFGRYKKRHVYKKIYKGLPIKSASEIQRGDYVVHIEHGIGKFIGIRQQFIDDITVDLLEILYKDNDKLLVPVDRIKFIQKYSGVEGFEPELDRLGSKKWLQRRHKSQEVIEKMAQELLQLYAKREMASRPSYSPDTIWQNEFEAGFIYTETPDQISAIEAVKDDLYKDKPMDRLICGDVGYGKTEVAIRAAFKCVMDKKQVAVLAPTTILAQQHYNTFKERFADFPTVKIEMLSRFRKLAQQIEIIKQLHVGAINIIIGTHRLLSQDVQFKDLGLLIIDEEQRFGVAHKEKIKEMRASVDILTLTATPIPRTLYLALSGLRDLSVIETPPPDRLPIKTKTIHFRNDDIREAILRELNRGGQIYFVHNRIFNIHEIATKLSEMVPQANIAVSHGRMSPVELEKIMTEFVEGKYDILVSTTIIENGLDIPNVNTIIINRADAFGLAQLYQLRGRVGRSSVQAYAYLIVPHGQAITETAVRRLQTIEEFTDLGVGFQIAMRDMEIRGTGNILGKEQHGCILSVGFELYCQLLEETVKRLRGIVVEEERPVDLKWRCDCYIPQDYIPLETQRVSFYKRLADANDFDNLNEISDELKDRYGELPEPVENLIALRELSISASKAGFYKIASMTNGFKFFAEQNIKEIIEKCELLIKKLKFINIIRFESDQSIRIIYNLKNDITEKEKIQYASLFFEELRNFNK